MPPLRDQIVVVRLTPDEAAHLRACATRTQRTMSQVVRLLLSQAEASVQPDIHVVNCQEQDYEGQ